MVPTVKPKPGRASSMKRVVMLPKTLSTGRKRSALNERRGKILLVDPDPSDLAYYGLILGETACDVRAWASYDAALSALTSEQFDMIVVHQGRHNFEGKMILQRANEIGCQIPVVVLTRFGDTSCCLEAAALGAVDCLEEPVKITDLVQMLRTHLGGMASWLLKDVRQPNGVPNLRAG